MDNNNFEVNATQIPYQYRHSRFLGALVTWLEPETVIEIGTHIGATAVWLARSLQILGRGRLFCVDPFCWCEENQEEQWNANIDKCGVRDFVTLVKGRSQEVEYPPRVDFAYIDGNHTYDVCRADVEKVVSLGASLIAIHDTVSWEGSRRYADRIRGEIEATHDQEYAHLPGDWWRDFDIFEAEFECGITVLKKRLPKGPCEGKDIGEFWDKPTGVTNAAS